MKSKLNLIVALVIILTINFSKSNSQGCSDAGVCSINNSYPEHNDNEKFESFLKMHFSFLGGLSDNGILVYSLESNFQFIITPSLSLNVRLPFGYVSGNLGNFEGVKDIMFGTQYNLKEDDYSLIFSANYKTNSGKSNSKLVNNVDAPMQYQLGLGTHDLIFSAMLQFNNFDLSLGYQLPLNKTNNTFHPAFITTTDKYWESNELDRKSDIMFRARYYFDFFDTQMHLGIMPIYKLSNSTYIENSPLIDRIGNFEVEIDGSKGLTLNLFYNVTLIKDKNQTDLFIGMPVIVREARPDGLTRSLIVSISTSL